MKPDNIIPSDKTLKDILAELPETTVFDKEFMKLNLGIDIIKNDFDLQIYEYCMKVYTYKKINFFEIYSSLKNDGYGDFRQGIESWFMTKRLDDSLNTPKLYLDFLNELRFFGVAYYQGRPYSEYVIATENIINYYNNAKIIMAKNKNVKRTKKEEIINNYFNFSKFSENEFKKILNTFLTEAEQEEIIPINNTMLLAKTAPKGNYIVILKSSGKISKIGSSSYPLNNIAANYRKLNADSAFFKAVDADYIDDLIIALKIHYNFETGKIRITAKNRKYSSLDKAIDAYAKLGPMKKTEIRKIIKSNHVKPIYLPPDNLLIEKADLDQLLIRKINYSR